METLTRSESAKLCDLARSRGEAEAIALVGLRSETTFFKAAAGFPVARLTVEVIRHRLDRI